MIVYCLVLCILLNPTFAFASNAIKSSITQYANSHQPQDKRIRAKAFKMSTITDSSINRNVDNTKTWPCGDELDKRIYKLALPAMLNLAILPLVGAADVNKINTNINTFFFLNAYEFLLTFTKI